MHILHALWNTISCEFAQTLVTPNQLKACVCNTGYDCQATENYLQRCFTEGASALISGKFEQVSQNAANEALFDVPLKVAHQQKMFVTIWN